MKVLIIPSWYPTIMNPYNGIFFKEQAEALSRKGLDVYLLLLEGISIRKYFNKKIDKIPKFDLEKKDNISLLRYKYIEFPKIKIIKNIQRKIIIKDLVKCYSKYFPIPDVIHLHSFFNGDIALQFKKYSGIPYLVTEHSSKLFRNNLKKSEMNLATNVFKNADYLISVSVEFCKMLINLTNIKFNYIPNMVNTDNFYIKSLNKEYEFINVASLEDVKNQIMLIRAFKNIYINQKSKKMIIVGDGSLKNIIQKEINDLGLKDQVILFGKATKSQIHNLLNSSKYFVLSSKYETFGISIIEAMSCGLPVIATKSGGPETIIKNNKLGILVDNNISSLINGMKKIVKIKYQSKYIRKYVIMNFSEDVIIRRIIDLYENIIKKYNNTEL